MYNSLKNIPNLATRAMQNPRLIVGETRKYGIKANRLLHSLSGDRGIDVMAEDWDNLLILDGCRYDVYAEQDILSKGQVESRTSRASTSQTFIDRNFNGRDLHDTVYVTANPFVKDLDDDTFHAVYDTFDDWDDELQTVPPEAVAGKAQHAHTRHPNKRLIVHFMQPHYPFIGELGQTLSHRGFYLEGSGDQPPSVWAALQYGYENYEDLTIEQVWDAYQENLEIVLTYVDGLLDDLVGRTVISADHGNLVGDRLWPIPVRAFGHPRGLQSRELTEVPWHIIDCESRKQVTSETPRGTSTSVQKDVSKQLDALGYR